MKLMTYEEAVKYIKEADEHGGVLSLDSIRELLRRLGNPQDNLKFVHIAGTNGKGSVAAYISTILAEAGYFIGRYISPTIFEYRERIQIVQREAVHYIDEDSVAQIVTKIAAVIQHMKKDGIKTPTSFEIETAMAFIYFVDTCCDIVVLEVGLGGRVDATNVIKNVDCAVITPISMDHMQFLGTRLEEIAYEKTGIIKDNCHVVSYEQETAVEQVIKYACEEKSSNLKYVNFSKISHEIYTISGSSFDYGNFKNLKIRLLGENQIKNCVLAIETILTLRRVGYMISDKEIYEGLRKTEWKGRFEVIGKHPDFIIDGAHNENAAIVLRKSIDRYFKDKRKIFIMGVFADKEYGKILEQTGDMADMIITVTPPNRKRALNSKNLAKKAVNYCSNIIDAGNVGRGIEIAYSMADENDVIVVFGSLSLVGITYEKVKNMGKNCK